MELIENKHLFLLNNKDDNINKNEAELTRWTKDYL